jgi:hypothetical protein
VVAGHDEQDQRAEEGGEQSQSSVRDGEEEKWERPSPVVPTRGIRSASPCEMAATGGVRSPSHHRLQCRPCELATVAIG